jgi:hypothetical protein
MRAGFDSREQRLRLGDLGHFRRRRKAFECGREDSVCFDETAGRLTESLASDKAARSSKLRARSARGRR